MLLQFTPGAQSPGPEHIEILIVSDGISSVQTFVRQGWDRDLQETDRDYLAALMSDWSKATDAPSLLQDLSELSIRPLLAIERGKFDNHNRTRLLEVACGGLRGHN